MIQLPDHLVLVLVLVIPIPVLLPASIPCWVLPAPGINRTNTPSVLQAPCLGRVQAHGSYSWQQLAICPVICFPYLFRVRIRKMKKYLLIGP